MLDCDVLVIGCGPAGACAARAAAMSGAKTIVVERNAVVGTPVRCAEGVGEYLLGLAPFRIPKGLLRWRIEGMRFRAENLKFELKGGFWEGYTIDRDRFDQWLARLSEAEGAKVLTGTTIIFAEDKLDGVKAVSLSGDGKETDIRAKKVVVADGADSKASEYLGYDLRRRNVGHVYGMELRETELGESRFETIFFGDFTTIGYGYIFPKGNGIANVGVGGELSEGEAKRKFFEFVEMREVREKISGAKFGVEKGGPCPLEGYPPPVKGNSILVGDAGNQNFKPFIEGVIPAVICGDIAGRVAAESAAGKAGLTDFNARVKEKLGDYFAASEAIYREMAALFRSEYPSRHLLIAGISSNLIKPDEISELEESEPAEIRKTILSRLGRLDQ
ncbi:MAG: NAD(P)/FAD-dependent oxidoreductase [Candidatus ainarchaeum sp.]|nr:NAD(P)/FAD-dependent oxidoreductase [Candidatus ainarchaeum sp.]